MPTDTLFGPRPIPEKLRAFLLLHGEWYRGAESGDRGEWMGGEEDDGAPEDNLISSAVWCIAI